MKKIFILPVILLALVLLTPQYLRTAHAAEVSSETLHFGNGSQGWSLYTDEALTKEYAKGKWTTWTAGKNALKLKDFSFQTTAAEALKISCDTRIVLEGSNTLGVTTGEGTARAIFVAGGNSNRLACTIEGKGGLAITASGARSSYAMFITDADLTVASATLQLLAKESPYAANGIYCSNGSPQITLQGATLIAEGEQTDPQGPNKDRYYSNGVNGEIVADKNTKLMLKGYANAYIGDVELTGLDLIGSTDYGTDPLGAIAYDADKKYYQKDGVAVTYLTTKAPALTITSENKKTIEEGTAGTFHVIATGSDAITYTLEGQPRGVTIDNTSGVMSFADTLKKRTYEFTIKASADSKEAATQKFTLTVTGKKEDPKEDPKDDVKETAQKGTVFSSGKYTYKISSAKTKGKGTVTLTGIVKGKTVIHVVVPKVVKYKNVTYKVTAVGTKAFYKNKKIKTATIGNSVTTLGNKAFYQCSNLKKVKAGTGLVKIGKHVFCHDKKLQTVTIKSKKLSSVGDHNLFKTKNLKIKVPAGKVKAYRKLFKKQGKAVNVVAIK